MATANVNRVGKKMKATKPLTSAARVELPRFRYLEDYLRYLSKMQEEVDDNEQLINQYQKQLASVLGKVFPVLAATTFDITPRDRKEQLKDLRKLKTVVDPTLKKIVIPNMAKLESQYKMAEDLHEKHKLLDSMESQMSLQFPDRRGDAFNDAINAIRVLKAKVADQLKQVLGFLHEVASKHVPESFQLYMDGIVSLINRNVIFKDSDLFLYVSVSDEGELVFTYYLMLRDVINDDGFITPHLYISVQWQLGNKSSVQVQLNHEYEVPNKLIGHGEAVGSVQEALKAISDLLDIENFSTALGVIPLSLQLKVDPHKMNMSMFSYRDMIAKVVVDDNYLKFELRPECNTPELIKQVATQLYMELRGLVKGKGTKLLMKTEKNVVTFNLSKLATQGEFNAYDFEFMRDKFGLNDAKLRKIAKIINSGSGE